MARARFHLLQPIQMHPDDAFALMCDWADHARWVPFTTVAVHPAGGLVEPPAPPATDADDPSRDDLDDIVLPADAPPRAFTAITGFGPLKLEDRMAVVAFDAEARSCTVRKLGPMITGEASFVVHPLTHRIDAATPAAVIEWREDVTFPRLPQVLAPLLAFAGRLGFRLALRRFPPR